MENNKNIMIISGETSGDIHAKNLIKATREKTNNRVTFYGMGGEMLKKIGVGILFPAEKISVVGITEVFFKIFAVLKALSILKKTLRERRPDILILIDFPDFNFIIGKYAKKLNIPILYYISPQIWAWRKGRIKTIKKMVSHMAVILPFEKDFYDNDNIPSTYVGHPILDEIDTSKLNLDEKKTSKIIALLPGSRKSSIIKHLDIMLSSALLIKKKEKNIGFILLVAPSIDENYIKKKLKKRGMENIVEITNNREKAMTTSSFVILSSGTATLETVIYERPMLIMYKLSFISYLIAKCLVKIKNIGLVNLIAGKTIVPELIQKDASPTNIAETTLNIICNEKKMAETKKELKKVKNLLGNKGASENTADLLLKML